MDHIMYAAEGLNLHHLSAEYAESVNASRREGISRPTSGYRPGWLSLSALRGLLSTNACAKLPRNSPEWDERIARLDLAGDGHV